MSGAPLGVFAGYGIELEYMIVARDSLAVLPIGEQLFSALAAERDDAVAGLEWSNEIVAHVAEVKNVAPQLELEALAAGFGCEIVRANHALAPHGAQLMPTAMHPWMDPRRETRLWRHDPQGIYRTYERIFDCRTHGWSNVQGMHLNFPFADDLQFERLHAAIRLVVPILPALAASSPFVDGGVAPCADTRLHACATSAPEFPSIAGLMVPETATSRVQYETEILAPMYRDIAAHDPEGVLQHEWLNSRAAIPRFDRNAIEIRAFDVQECPRADVAIAQGVVAAVKQLYECSPEALRVQQAIPTAQLAAILATCITHAEEARVTDRDYLRCMGYPGKICTARDLWVHMLDGAVECRKEPWRTVLELILKEGPLARRLLRATGGEPSHQALHELYAALCACLAEGRLFRCF